jgi:hypothetical protein
VDVLVALIVVALIAIAIYLGLTAIAHREPPAPTWTVSTRSLQDGTTIVSVRSDHGEERIREIPPSLQGDALAAALRSARAEAQARADELNRLEED